MQMINVMKRLAELDAQNPNMIQESQQVDECGMMGGMGMGSPAPSTPASINMTAGSGPELSGMLRDIMSLAGLQGAQTGGHDDVEILTTEPEVQQGPQDAGNATDAMRSVIDKLHPEMDGDNIDVAQGDVDDDGDHDMDDHDKEETDEGQYDNSPSDPTDANAFDAEEFAHHENPPGAAKGRGNYNNPRANTMEEIEQNLIAEYQKFISED